MFPAKKMVAFIRKDKMSSTEFYNLITIFSSTPNNYPVSTPPPPSDIPKNVRPYFYFLLLSAEHPSRPAAQCRGSSASLFPPGFQRRSASPYPGNSVGMWRNRCPRSSVRPCLGSSAPQCPGSNASQFLDSSAGKTLIHYYYNLKVIKK
jgi:hypothetical protein